MSEEQVVRRGRPSKASEDQAESVGSKENAEAHVALKQQRQYLKARGKKPVEEWFVLEANKLKKKSKWANGNVSCEYVGQLKPSTKDPKRKAENELLKTYIETLRKSGQLRA